MKLLTDQTANTAGAQDTIFVYRETKSYPKIKYLMIGVDGTFDGCTVTFETKLDDNQEWVPARDSSGTAEFTSAANRTFMVLATQEVRFAVTGVGASTSVTAFIELPE